jgi:hypothetical protein
MFTMSISCGVSEKSENDADIDFVSIEKLNSAGIIGGCYEDNETKFYYFCIESFNKETEYFKGTVYIIDKNRFNDIGGLRVTEFSDNYIEKMTFVGKRNEFIEKIKKDNENIFKIGYCYVKDYDKDENPFKNKPKTPESLLCVKDKKNGYILLDIYSKYNNKWYKREESENINYYAGWFDKEYGLKKDIFPENAKKVKK